MTTIFYQ